MATDIGELVAAFNAELQSIYEVKPPISKGKMTAITKAALKSPMLYKHVVQSVEKLIQKCKSEYKIPGLYVIDSIIRQSRHQYGIDKDLFAGRFARNIKSTFVHIYRCPEEDKPKVIRVLNLWQKNKIFQPEVIAPLFDLADPNNPIWETMPAVSESGVNSASGVTGNGTTSNTLNSFFGEVQFKSHLLDYDYDEDPPDDGDRTNAQNSSSSSTIPKAPPPPILRQDPGGIAGMDALGSILSNPEVLRQLQTLQEQMTAAAQQQAHVQHHQVGFLTPEQERQRKLAELNKQEAAFDQRLAQTVANTPFAADCGDFIEAQEKVKSPEDTTGIGFSHGSIDQNSNQLGHSTLAPPSFFQHMPQEQGRVGNPFGLPLSFPLISSQFASQHQQSDQQMGMYAQLQADSMYHQNFQSQQQPAGHSVFDPSIQQGEDDDRNNRDRDSRERGRSDRRRRRSRSRDRSRRSRSRSVEILSPRSRSRRSRSSSRNNSSSRSNRANRSRERREEKERQRKGFGIIKRENLSVCSTTLWVGHLSKLVSQEELSDTFGQYGDIVSIDMIQSRGCAFVVMNRRQDAVKALDRLRNKKLQGKEITLAWAPGKGVKGRDWKDYWEVEHGISYIPWAKLTIETDLEEFEEGGCVDESTLPDFLKNRPKKEKVEPATKEKEGEGGDGETNHVAGTPAEETNGVKASAPEIPVPTPVPAVMPTPAPFGMPPGVGMLGVSPMGMNMMMPPPLMGGPMAMPPFMMPMMNLNPDPSSQMNNSMPPGGGLMGDMPLLPPQLNNSSASLPNPAEEDNRMGGDENGKINPPERKERKRSRFDNADDRISPDRPADRDERNDSPKKELRSGDGIFDRLKSIADGYGGGGLNNSGSGPDIGMKMANSLLGSPIGPPPLLGSPRGPQNNFRGGFRPFMSERMPGGGGNRPWFDAGPPPSQNPFMNPSQNPFGPPFLNENPFDVDGPGGRRPPPRGDNREFYGGPNDAPHFGSKRGGGGGWDRGGPAPWRGRGGMRGRGRGGPWRGGGPKTHHNNFVVNNP